MAAKLTYRDKEGRNVTVNLSPEGTIVGRAERCAIRISHPTVSSTHCQFSLADGKWHIEDLGSTNGTFLNGRRLEKHKKTPISPKDALACGSLKLRFQTDEVAAPPEPELPEAEEEEEGTPEETDTAQVAELRRKQDQLQADNTRLQAELSQAQKEQAELREQVDAARTAEETAQRLVQQLREQVHRLSEQVHKLSEQHEAAQTQIQTLREQLASIRAQKPAQIIREAGDSASQDLPALALIDLRDRHARAQREIRALRAELERVRMLSVGDPQE